MRINEGEYDLRRKKKDWWKKIGWVHIMEKKTDENKKGWVQFEEKKKKRLMKKKDGEYPFKREKKIQDWCKWNRVSTFLGKKKRLKKEENGE